MDAFLNVTMKLLAFGDKSLNSNPRLRYVDWNRDASGIQVRDPKAESHSIDPGATKLIFDGTRATTISGSSAFAVSLSPLDPSRYRLTWTGGTNPTFRTDRSLALNGIAVTIAVQANSTIIMSVPAGPDFTGVNAGDTVFIPDASTGDTAGPFSPLNGGFWQVLAVLSSTSLSLARFAGVDFAATNEVVTVTSAPQLQAFSTAGVQVGDKVDISAGFATSTRKTFDVVAVTSTFIEVISTTALPPETGITPGTTGMIFYTDSKSVIYVEVDQEACIRLNGSTDNSQRLSPIEAGNPDRPAPYFKRGPAWSLSIVNRAPVTLNVVVIHAE